jgi:hypothetical protein
VVWGPKFPGRTGRGGHSSQGKHLCQGVQEQDLSARTYVRGHGDNPVVSLFRSLNRLKPLEGGVFLALFIDRKLRDREVESLAQVYKVINSCTGRKSLESFHCLKPGR